jgi:hypothetical protein
MDEGIHELYRDFVRTFGRAVKISAAYSSMLQSLSNGFGRRSQLPFPEESIRDALFFLLFVMKTPELGELVCQEYPDAAEQVRSGDFSRGLKAGLMLLPGFVDDEEAALMERFFSRSGDLTAAQHGEVHRLIQRHSQYQQKILAEADRFGIPRADTAEEP